MDCRYSTSDKQLNPVKRKRMEEAELQPKHSKKAKKRRRREKNTENFFNRYLLGKLLGKGGFGSVFEGIRKSDGKRVALKYIVRNAMDQYITLPGDTRRLPLEVALMELVCKPPHCPYIIELVDWIETDIYCILVLEQPDPCVDLFTYCTSPCENITENDVKMILHQVVQAARHCHDRGVLHRDIKEENLLLNPQTLDVKLIDFGCGDLLKDTLYTQYRGTDHFIPPEMLISQEYKGEPATVWGLGIMIYGLLCKAEPFNGKKEIIDGLLHFPDHLCEASRSLIRWCLQRDPKGRPTLEQMLTHEWWRPCHMHADCNPPVRSSAPTYHYSL